MKKLCYLLASSMLIWFGCSEENVLEGTPTGENVINATFEQSTSGSRVALVQDGNDNLSLTWTEGDAIAMFGEDGSKAIYTLNPTSAGQTNGSFVGTTQIEGNIRGVAYPYYETNGTANIKCDQYSDMEIVLPSEITFDPTEPTKCNVPMWGELSNNGNVSFKHLGSLLKIDFTDMPAGYDQLIVSASSPISGIFRVKVDSDEPILLGGTPSEENKKITIKFTALTDGETENDKVFYLPLPSGTYASLSVAIGKAMDSNANLVLRNWTNIAFERAKYYTAAVAYVAVSGSDVNAINSALTSAISEENTTAQLVMEEAITAGGNIEIPENSTNVSLDFTTVSGTSETTPLTITSDASAASGEATKTLSLNVPTNDTEGSYVTVNTPTSTVNLNGGKFHTLTATTATNTLIVGEGVEITNLIVEKGNIRIKKGGIIATLTYEGEEDIFIILEEGAEKPTTITDTNSKVKTVSGIEYDLANQPQGTVYNFTSDMILTQPLYIENDVTVELNGYRITHCGESFTDPNNDKALVVVKRGGKLTVNNKYGDGRISVLGFDDNHNVGINNLNIHSAIKMTAAGESSTGKTASLILNQGYIEGNYYCICGNGNRHDTYIEINGGWISSLGGEIHQDLGSETLGIYHPQNGTLKIYGGTIKGYESAVEMRGGELVVDGGWFEVEGVTTEFSTRPNSNGNTVIGAAIAISPHQGRTVKATINNAYLKGPHTLHEEYMYDGEVPQIELSMSNISFETGEGYEGDVYSENCKEFITGNFVAKRGSILNYLGEGAEVHVESNMEITKAIPITKTVTVYLNNYTIENKTAASTTGLDDAEDECIVFFANGEDANLTINATNGGKVVATGDGEKSYYNVAVWAMNNANVTINGGEFSNTADPEKDGCDLIYGRNGANISITGGTFKAGAIRSNLGGGIYGVLNCKDKNENNGITQSTITLSGGKFYEFGSTEASKVGSGEVILLESGYKWTDKDSDGYYSVVQE